MKLHITGLVLLFALIPAVTGCEDGNTVNEPQQELSEADQKVQEEMQSEEYEEAMSNMN